MGFAHHRNHSDLAESKSDGQRSRDGDGSTHSTGRSDRPCLQFGQQCLLIIVWNGTDDIHKPRYASISKLLAQF